MEVNLLRSKKLTEQEKAYILDSVGGSSYYADSFGELNEKTEKEMIVSIFLKLQNL